MCIISVCICSEICFLYNKSCDIYQRFVFYFAFCCFDETHQFWEFISYYKLYSSLKEARAGAQDRNLEAGIEAETKEDCSLLACFP